MNSYIIVPPAVKHKLFPNSAPRENENAAFCANFRIAKCIVIIYHIS